MPSGGEESPGVGDGRKPSFPRHVFARGLQNRWPSRNRGRRESRVPTAPAVSCAKRTVIDAHEHTGSAETARLSPRNGFTAYFVLSPVSGLFCHRRRRDTSRQLSASIAAPGPHDFAVRLGVFVRRKKTPDAKASIASRAQRVVTMAIRPSGGRETAGLILLIVRNAKRNIFVCRTGQPKSA